MIRRRRARAFTLIELLVILSILALVLALLLPSISRARAESVSVKCIYNLKSLGRAAQSNGLADPAGILHAQSESGRVAWLGLGAWDFGGSDGRCGAYSSGWTASPYNLGVLTRPYNIAAAGPSLSTASIFPEYQCPADIGAARIGPTNYVPEFPADDLTAPDPVFESMYSAVGTSYQGDFISFRGVASNDRPVAKRPGAFLLPSSRMQQPDQLLLFYEARFAQAMLSTQEAVDAGGAFGGTALDIPGWHGKLGEFNVAAADGSARKVTLLSRGSAVDTAAVFDAAKFPYRSVMYRGRNNDWRYDNLPYTDNNPDSLADWVTEYITGN